MSSAALGSAWVGVGGGQVAVGVGRAAFCSGMASDAAGLELGIHSLVQPVGIEGTPPLIWGEPGGERERGLLPQYL